MLYIFCPLFSHTEVKYHFYLRASLLPYISKLPSSLGLYLNWYRLPLWQATDRFWDWRLFLSSAKHDLIKQGYDKFINPFPLSHPFWYPNLQSFDGLPGTHVRLSCCLADACQQPYDCKLCALEVSTGRQAYHWIKTSTSLFYSRFTCTYPKNRNSNFLV